MMIKLSEEVVKKFGAQNAADFNEKLLAFVGSTQETIKTANSYAEQISALQEANKTLTANISDSAKQVGELKAKLEEVEGKIKSVDTDNIRQIAKTEGSAAAQAALGSVGASGGNVIPPSPPAPAARDYVAFVRENIAAGMSKADAIQAAIKSHPKEYAEARIKGIPTI